MVAAVVVLGWVMGSAPMGGWTEHGGERIGVQVRSARLMAPSAPAAGFAPGIEAMFQPDKLLHMSISANLALAGSALARQLGLSPKWAMVIGATVALAAGAAKELWDLRGNGQADWGDVGADLIGTTAGVTLSLLFSGP